MAKAFCESEKFASKGKSKWPMEMILGGIIWILRTGAQWRSLPQAFPPRSTVHRWLQKLGSDGVFLAVLREWIEGFYRVYSPKSTGYVDGMFVEAKGGGEGVGNTKCGKGTKLMVITNDDIVPMAVSVGSASPHELKFLPQLLDSQFFPEHKFDKLVGDKAYDSDKHDKQLSIENGIELIAPNKRNRKNNKQDGRKMKVYRKRHHVENLNAHLQNYRRVVTRYEKRLSNFLSIVLLACWSIIFNKIYAVMG